MLSRSFTRLAAFGIVTAFSLLVTPNAASKDVRNLSFDEFRKQAKSEYAVFKDSVKRDYAAFRDSVNRAYAEFMRNPWTLTSVEEHVDAPDEKDFMVYMDPDDNRDLPVTDSRFFNLESVVMPMWTHPQATPFGEIEEQPTDDEKEEFMRFYGTPIYIRDTDLSAFRLNGDDEMAFADGWEILSRSENNNFINDCLSVRDSLALPDWGYAKFLEKIAAKLVGEDTNEQTMLLGFLMNQSGYKIRFSYDDQKKLHLLLGSNYYLYNHRRCTLDNVRYISYTRPSGDAVYICNFKVPGEQMVDFGIHKSPKFEYSPCATKEINVVRYPELTFRLTPNKNLVDFYGDYPVVTTDIKYPYSRWAVHGNTPVSDEVKNELYPSLRKIVEGKSEYDALQILLKLAQSFPYAYDDEVWGGDRAFWMEESWAYPFSDCEDHAINFSHIVRDILGLDVCLLYFPRHLSACVALTDQRHPGDYVVYDGRKYLICDPTSFYGRAGELPNDLDSSGVIMIPLRRQNDQ